MDFNFRYRSTSHNNTLSIRLCLNQMKCPMNNLPLVDSEMSEIANHGNTQNVSGQLKKTY